MGRGRIAPDSRFLGRLRRLRSAGPPSSRWVGVGSPPIRAPWGGAGGPGRRRAARCGKTHPPFCRASSCISPRRVNRMTGCFLLHRPIARRPTLAGRSAARGISTGVTSRGTPGRTRPAGQPVCAQVARRVVNPRVAPGGGGGGAAGPARKNEPPDAHACAPGGRGLAPISCLPCSCWASCWGRRRPGTPMRGKVGLPEGPGHVPKRCGGARRAPPHRARPFAAFF